MSKIIFLFLNENIHYDPTLELWVTKFVFMEKYGKLSLNYLCDPFLSGALLKYHFKSMCKTGLPQSGKNIWKMKFFPGQGKVREFCGWPGIFKKDL